MANVYYAPARATGGVKHVVDGTQNTIQSAMSGVRDVLLNATWTLDTMRPGHARIPFIFQVPWGSPDGAGGWTGNAVNPGNGYVYGIWQFVLAIDGVSYNFYNPVAGQEVPPGHPVPIGNSNLATIASLAGELEDWIATAYDNSHMDIEYAAMTYDDVGASSHVIAGSAAITGSTEQPWGGGYRMTSQAPSGNSSFSIWITEHDAHGLGFQFPDLAAGGDPDYEIRMARSNAYDVWANSYGFGLWESGDVPQNPPAGDSYGQNRSIIATRPYLSSDVPVSDVLSVMWGQHREGMHPILFELFKGRMNGAITASTDSLWAFYLPRTNNTRSDIVTTADKPLMVDAIIAMSPDNTIHPRMLGWFTDCFISTDGNAIDGQAELSGNLWDAVRCNLTDSSAGAVGTLWLRVN
jgi:hypothetical protein